MSAPQFAGAFLVFFAVGLFIPGIVQRRRARIRLRASLLADLRADLRTTASERDELHGLVEAQGTTIAAYRNANVRLVDFIRDQQEEAGWTMPDLWDASVETPTFFNAAAQRDLAWLDEQTWGRS